MIPDQVAVRRHLAEVDAAELRPGLIVVAVRFIPTDNHLVFALQRQNCAPA